MKLLMPGILTLSLVPLLPTASQAQTVHGMAMDTIFELEGAVPATLWQSASDTVSNSTYAIPTATTPGTADDNAPALAVSVNVDRLANYAVWARVVVPTKTPKAFFAKLGTQPVTTISANGYDNLNTKWVKLGVGAFAPGKADIKIKFRDLGIGFDKLIVTRYLTYLPTGVGIKPDYASAIPRNDYPAFPAEFTPPATRPRLFLTPGSLEQVRKSRQLHGQDSADPDGALMYAVWNRLAIASKANTTLAVNPNLAQCKDYGKAIYSRALFYQLDGTVSLAREAVQMMRTYIDACAFEIKDEVKQPMSARPAGEMMMFSALVYDWCWNAGVITAADKDLFLRRFLERAPMEIGFPPEKQGHIVGHGSETQLMRDQMSVGIAFYEEGSKWIYDIVAGKFFRDFVPVRKDLLYKSGAFHQGTSYGQSRFISDMFAAWIFKRMHGVDVFTDKGRDMLYHPIYMRRPDGQMMRDGDNFDSRWTASGRYWSQPWPYLLASSFYGDSYFKREFLLQRGAFGGIDDLWLALFNDPELKAAQQAPTLPLTRFYGEPAGYMVARTGWPVTTADAADPLNHKSNVVIATMKVGHTNFANHQHLDAGHFQIYYKGGLAIDSGIYEGIDPVTRKDVAYFSDHDRNYHKRTVAHNAMLVYDGSETFDNGNSINDGGQQFITPEPASLSALIGPPKPKYEYVYGSGMRHKIGPVNANAQPDFSYLKGDLTNAYTDKVEAYQRSFVFLTLRNANVPAAMIVLDRIRTSNSTFPKRWLLHSINAAEVDSTARTITIKNGTTADAGKLINKTLLPADVAYKQYGVNPGERYFVGEAPGQEYPIDAAANTSEETSPHRVEVSPTKNAELILNVMQVTGAQSTTQVPVELVPGNETDPFVGVKVDDRIVFFARKAANIAATASFTVKSIGSNVLVTDLAPGTWRVARDGATLRTQFTVTDDDGTIYLPAAASGTYTLELVSAAM